MTFSAANLNPLSSLWEPSRVETTCLRFDHSKLRTESSIPDDPVVYWYVQSWKAFPFRSYSWCAYNLIICSQLLQCKIWIHANLQQLSYRAWSKHQWGWALPHWLHKDEVHHLGPLDEVRKPWRMEKFDVSSIFFHMHSCKRKADSRSRTPPEGITISGAEILTSAEVLKWMLGLRAPCPS